MSLTPILVDALVPVAFVLLLGFLAGRWGIFKPENGNLFTNLAITYCLPALLFNATATMTASELHDWRFFLGIGLGLISTYVLALAVSLLALRRSFAAGSLQALCCSFPSMALVGLPVMLPIIGKSSLLGVAFGNLVVTVFLVPVVVMLLESSQPSDVPRSRGAIVRSSILQAIKQPLVWAPFTGLLLAAIGLPWPDAAQKSLALIGDATSGLALFATGLLLSGRTVRLTAAVVTNVALKNIAQPFLMWGFATMMGLTAIHRQEMVLLGAVPMAVGPMLLAVRYQVFADEAETTILLTTILSIFTIGIAIAVTS